MDKYTIQQHIKVLWAYNENGRLNENAYRTLCDGEFIGPNCAYNRKRCANISMPSYWRKCCGFASTQRHAQQLYLFRSSLMRCIQEDLHLHFCKVELPE